MSNSNEEALRESQARLSGIVDSAMDAIITVDEKQMVLVFNRAAEEMFQCPAGQALGQSLDRFIPERFRPAHSSHIQSFGQTGVTTRAMGGARSVFGLRANGEEFPVEASISQVEAGGQILFTVIMRDITERKRSEEALDETNQRLQTFIQASPLAIVALDMERKVTLWNPAAESFFGWTQSEVIDRPLPTIPNEDVKNQLALREQFLRAEGTPGISNLEGRRRRKDGSIIDVSVSFAPLRDRQGSITGTIGIFADITERKRAEERFRLVVEAAPSAMLMVNDAGLMTLVNRQAEHLFGYQRVELLNQPVEVLVPERYRSQHPGHRALFSRHPTSRAMGAGRDLFGLRKDGTEVPIEIGLNPVHTIEGEFVLASIIDITERKRSEQTFQQLIEGAPNGMVMVNQEGKITLVNAQIEQSFGYPREELIGRPIEMLVPARFRAKHPDYRNGFIAAPTTRSMGAGRDLFGLRRDGSEFPVEIGLNPLETEKGTMVLGTIVDITERKRNEEDLRRSQEQLAGVIGQAMDAIITIDEEQRIVLFNAAAEKMFLYPAEEAMGQRLERFIPKRFRPAHDGHIEDFGRTHVTKRAMGSLGAIFGLRADGEEFPIEASISQLESEGHKFYTVILRDITERKRSEEALKEQARILDLAPVLIRDLSGRILFWNTGAQQMYGWKSEEALDKITHQLLQTEFPRPLEEIKARLFAHGHWEGELVHSKRDGERIVVASHWVLHKNDQDEPRAVLEVNNDITERRQAEKEIRRLNEELEQRVADRTAQLQAANKELEAFSYSVSHDLRAPLRHINGFSQALLEDYADKLDELGKGYLQEVRGASQEMAQLIDDVLQLARVTRTEMRREFVNLSELAHSISTEMQNRDAQRTVVFDIEEGLTTQGDKRLLRIVLNNLLGNAWKFTAKQERAEIHLGQKTEGGESVYFVRDNGAGFDMSFVDKLFGAFQRLHTAGEFEGTGIGLATVQRIVHRHGGRVWAEGSVNEGATFYFTLPSFKETVNGEQSDLTG